MCFIHKYEYTIYRTNYTMLHNRYSIKYALLLSRIHSRHRLTRIPTKFATRYNFTPLMFFKLVFKFISIMICTFL